MNYKEIEGDLIDLAKKGSFDIIAQGCNCFCTQNAGIAVAFKKNFGTNNFKLERITEIEFDGDEHYEVETHNKGDVNKMGQIDYSEQYINLKNNKIYTAVVLPIPDYFKHLTIINCYTQYGYGNPKGDLDYEALTLCLRKINSKFRGMSIGLPKIGAGLAGGDWNRIKQIIQTELRDMDVTVVIYKP